MSHTFTRYPYTGPEDHIAVPTVEAPWTSARTARTIAHQLLEDAKNIFTLRPPAPRTGEMLLRFPTPTDAHTAANFFATPAEFDLYPVDPPELSARFTVTGGDIRVEQSIGSWVVRLPWMEVIP